MVKICWLLPMKERRLAAASSRGVTGRVKFVFFSVTFLKVPEWKSAKIRDGESGWVRRASRSIKFVPLGVCAFLVLLVTAQHWAQLPLYRDVAGPFLQAPLTSLRQSATDADHARICIIYARAILPWLPCAASWGVWAPVRGDGTKRKSGVGCRRCVRILPPWQVVRASTNGPVRGDRAPKRAGIWRHSRWAHADFLDGFKLKRRQLQSTTCLLMYVHAHAYIWQW